MTETERSVVDDLLRDIDSLEDDIKSADDYWKKYQVLEPTHYTCGRFETIEKIMTILTKLGADPFTSFCVGNAIKYVDRAGSKAVCGDLDKGFDLDTHKAANYLHMALTGEWLEC